MLSKRVENDEFGPMRGDNKHALKAAIAALEAQLLAHIENEGDECPLCRLEAQVVRLRKYAKHHFGCDLYIGPNRIDPDSQCECGLKEALNA